MTFLFHCDFSDETNLISGVSRGEWWESWTAGGKPKDPQWDPSKSCQVVSPHFFSQRQSFVILLRSDEDSRVKAEKLKEKALELAELRKKLEDADADIVAKDANIVEKVAEIENLKGLIKVLLCLRNEKLRRFWRNLLRAGGQRDNRSSEWWTWCKNGGAEVGDEEIDWDKCRTLQGDISI